MAGVGGNKACGIKWCLARGQGQGHALWRARKRVGHRGFTRNGPQTNPNKGPTRARCAAGQWPGLVCGTAAPAVVIREYQALGEVDNLNVNICLLI